ncbi:MAG TPA: hypothetical protein VMG10_02210 [Gemmataceae bacterium]|nr:hypothetical protein [Gemmataceae bacterium]
MSVYRLPLRTGLAGLLLVAGSAFTSAAEIEAGLPADTTAVVTVNLKQLLHAPVLKQHGLDSLRQLCRNTEGIRETLTALGLDPFRDLDRLTVACIGLGEKSEGVYIVRGRFDTARFHLVAKMLVKKHSEHLTMHKDDKLKYISVVSTGNHGSLIFGAGANSKKGAMLNVQTKGCLLDMFGDCCLALLDKNTLVAATSEKLLKETCQRIADKDSSALNKRMRRLLAEQDGKQTILFAMRQAQPTTDKSLAASREYYGRALEKAAASRGLTLEEMWEENWKTPMPYPTINQCDGRAREGKKELAKAKTAEQVKQKNIARLMKQYNELFKEAKYAEAETVALRVKELDPDNAMATAAIAMARFQRSHNQYESDTDKSDSGQKSDPEIVPSLFPASFLPPPPFPEPPSSEAKEEPSKSSWELSGSISLAEDFTLRCAVRTTNTADARVVMKGFKELRLRASGLMTFLAGSSKEYAFLKDIPRSFLAVRKGRVILVEGRLSPETLDKLLGTCSVKNP